MKPEFLDLAVAIHPQVRGPDWCSGNNICWWQYPHCWKCANSVTVVGHEHYLKVFTVFICQQRRCPILSCSAKLCQCIQCHWMWQLRREGVFYQVMTVPSCYVSHHLLPACLPAAHTKCTFNMSFNVPDWHTVGVTVSHKEQDWHTVSHCLVRFPNWRCGRTQRKIPMFLGYCRPKQLP